jgi:hypothetical protein
MSEEDQIQDPAELETENQLEEQIGDAQQQTPEESAPSVEDQVSTLIKDKGLEGRWGDKTGLDAVGAALDSYRNMEAAYTRQQQGLPPQATPQPAGVGQPQPQTPDLLDGFVDNPQGYINNVAQQQINQQVPLMVDQALARQYVQDNPDIIANEPAILNILQRNQLQFSNANIRFAHQVFKGDRQDQFTAAQATFQQGQQQGASLASQKQAAHVEGGHKSPPRDAGVPGYEALVKKYGVGNIPEDELEAYFDQAEGKRMEE